uniref:Gag-pol polyprotein n=1 Tax=Solanum tuberosum TaxID=4113 RepID=M1DWB2_SOLTU
MYCFVTGVSDLVKEECRTAMLHDDLNISRLVVYAQSIEEYKLMRVKKDLKRGRSDEQGQLRFKKRAPNQDLLSAPKNLHKVGDCPTLTARGREAKEESHGGPNLGDQKKTRFYALQANKKANPDEGAGAPATIEERPVRYFKYVNIIKLPFRIHSSKSKPLCQKVLSRTPLKLKVKLELALKISCAFFFNFVGNSSLSFGDP